MVNIPILLPKNRPSEQIYNEDKIIKYHTNDITLEITNGCFNTGRPPLLIDSSSIRVWKERKWKMGGGRGFTLTVPGKAL